MIISASRRTDIPAFFSTWLRNRIDAGYCLVPHPMNPAQVARVSLRPADVDAIVFWTRHARPLFSILPLLDRRGYGYYFLYTITGYGRPVESRTPPLDVAIATARDLATRIRPGAVVWRYDPLLVGPAFPPDAHAERFARIAAGLAGHTRRVLVSVVELYRKTARRLGQLYDWDLHLSREPRFDPGLSALLRRLVDIAADHGMVVEACAQPHDYTALGIGKAKCIDDRLLTELFGGKWRARKDPGQRPACGCAVSKDIGIPDTCTFGCAYCYATRGEAIARRRRRQHDPMAPSLLPRDSLLGSSREPLAEPPAELPAEPPVETPGESLTRRPRQPRQPRLPFEPSP